MIVVKQPTNNIRTTNATWVRKSTEGKVWLTRCRVKSRVLVNAAGTPTEYMCQMQDPELVDHIWQTINRTRSLVQALGWLYQS